MTAKVNSRGPLQFVDFNKLKNLLAASQEKIESLKRQVATNRKFLHMVIHDMRNPTTSIQFGITEALKLLRSYRANFWNIKTFIETKLLHEVNFQSKRRASQPAMSFPSGMSKKYQRN